jgi:hypothetical protein
MGNGFGICRQGVLGIFTVSLFMLLSFSKKVLFSAPMKLRTFAARYHLLILIAAWVFVPIGALFRIQHLAPRWLADCLLIVGLVAMPVWFGLICVLAVSKAMGK